MPVLVISYSREDQPQVRALVSLLKAAFRGIEKAVYWDGEFEPGDPWFEQIKQHIDAAPQLFVFWCRHSAASPHVKREFVYAFRWSKIVVPILLDNTPLAPELTRIHGIDLRDGSVITDPKLSPGWLTAPSLLRFANLERCCLTAPSLRFANL
jgi:hypothetical protein